MAVSATATWAVAEVWLAALSVNDSTSAGLLHYGFIWKCQAAGSFEGTSNGSAIVKLAATNTLRIKIYHNQGAALNTSGSELTSYFHIARII